LVKGAKVDALVGGCWTALFAATEKGATDVVELLLQHGADITLVNNLTQTALHVAARWGHEAIARLLLQYGATVCLFTNLLFVVKLCYCILIFYNLSISSNRKILFTKIKTYTLAVLIVKQFWVLVWNFCF
jgi:ankyrin repeat protein